MSARFLLVTAFRVNGYTCMLSCMLVSLHIFECEIEFQVLCASSMCAEVT